MFSPSKRSLKKTSGHMLSSKKGHVLNLLVMEHTKLTQNVTTYENLIFLGTAVHGFVLKKRYLCPTQSYPTEKHETEALYSYNIAKIKANPGVLSNSVFLGCCCISQVILAPLWADLSFFSMRGGVSFTL